SLEFFDNSLISPALERYYQVWQFPHRNPTPLDKFRLVVAARVGDIDLALVSRKTERIPFLFLPAILAAPGLLCNLARKLVLEPFSDLAKLLHRADIGFLVQFTQRRLVGIFVLVDTPLRHLPDVRSVDVFGPVCPPADEDESGTVEHHHARARSVRQ